MKRILFFLSFCVLLFSCERKTDWPLHGDLNPYIIVDGLLTNENGPHYVKLTYPVKALNENPKPVSQATVIISSDESLVTLTESPAGSGVYHTAPGFFAKPNQLYSLIIYLGNRIFTAKASMVQGATFKTLRYVRNGFSNFFHIEWVANPYHATRPAMWEINMDWSMVPGFQSLPVDSCKARLLYYTLPSLDVSQIFAPELKRINFPLGTRIVEKRFSLSLEHAAFIRSMLMETNWQGGLFSAAPANVTTNLSDGAMGFFGVCALNTDSLIVK